MVVEEAGQLAPVDIHRTNKTFSFNEGTLEIQQVEDDKRVLRISGRFTPGKYKTGEVWVLETYDDMTAAERRLQAFDKYHAEYMMRRLLFSYHGSLDNY